MIPTENAPNALMIENYREDEKVIMGLEGESTVPD